MFELCEQAVVTRELTESLSVMPDSIVTMVHDRDGNRDHFALRARQLGTTEHQLRVQRQVREHHSRMDSVNLEDVRHSAAGSGHFAETIRRLGLTPAELLAVERGRPRPRPEKEQ